MDFFGEIETVTTVPIKFNELMNNPPQLPHEYCKLLGELREEILNEDDTPDESWLPGAEHILYLWQKRWFNFQKKDVLESKNDGTLCETITGCVFIVLSALLHRKVLRGTPSINIFLMYNASEYGKHVLCLPSGQPVIHGWSNDLNLDQMLQLLYYINKNWFSYTYGHHQVMGELFPALLTRLLTLFEEDDNGDLDRENDLWICEAYLRRLWWPISLRSEFEIVALSSLEHYNREQYLCILGAVNEWVAEIMIDQNPKTMAWFRREVLRQWELPCIREIASRVMGTHRNMLSFEVIKKYTPIDLKMQMLDQIATGSSQVDVYHGTPGQVRQGLILVNVIANAKMQFDMDLSVSIKNRRHLWNIDKVRAMAHSSHVYMLQMAGSYMTVWDGRAFVSRTIEEAIAQMLYLDQGENLMRDTLMAMDFEPAQDDSSAHLLGFHKTSMAIVV